MKKAMGSFTGVSSTVITVFLLLMLSVSPAVSALDPPRWSEVEFVTTEPDARGVGIGIAGDDRQGLVWAQGDGPYSINYHAMDFDSKMVGATVEIGTTSSDTWIECITDKDRNLHILYIDGGHVEHALVSYDGEVISPPTSVVSSGKVNSLSADLAGEVLHIVMGTQEGIEHASLGLLGDPLSETIRISDTGSSPDILASADGGVIISYLGEDEDAVLVNRYSSQMGLISPLKISVGDSSILDPRMVLDSTGNILLFWTEDRGVEPAFLMLSRISPEDEIVIMNKELFDKVATNHLIKAKVDEEDKVHLMWYSLEGRWKLNYGIINTNGEPLIAPLWIDETGSPYDKGPGFDLEVDQDGYAHIAWSKGGIKYIDSRPRPEEAPSPLTREEWIALVIMLAMGVWLFFVNRWILGVKPKDKDRFNPLKPTNGSSGKTGKK